MLRGNWSGKPGLILKWRRNGGDLKDLAHQVSKLICELEENISLQCKDQQALNGIRSCIAQVFIRKSFLMKNWSLPIIFLMKKEIYRNRKTLVRIRIFR